MNVSLGIDCRKPDLTIVQVSARADKRKVSPALKKVTGIAPPPKTGETRIAPDSTTVHCIGPDRWVVVSETIAPTDSSVPRKLCRRPRRPLSTCQTDGCGSGAKSTKRYDGDHPVDLHPSVADAPCNLHSFITEATGLVAVLSVRRKGFRTHRRACGPCLEMLTETAAQYGYRTED